MLGGFYVTRRPPNPRGGQPPDGSAGNWKMLSFYGLYSLYSVYSFYSACSLCFVFARILLVKYERCTSAVRVQYE